MGGGLGTLAGAAIGSFVPGVGTALGASLGGAAGSMLGGGGGSLTSSNMGTQTNTSSTPNVPSWLLPYLQSNAQGASQLTSNHYSPYTGQQTAGLTGMQNQAGQLAQQLPGQAQAGFQQANNIQSQIANQGLNGLNPNTIQGYMNPYTQQVMDASLLRQQQQYQLAHNQLNAQQGQIGAFGGSRSALAQGQLYSNFAQQLSENEATQLSNNFTNAQNMAMQGLGQAGNAAQGMMQNTAGQQTAGLQNIGALQTAGGLEQTTNQNQLNAQYQDWVNSNNYDYQMLQNSQNILNPIASLTTGTNATGFNQQTGNPSILQTAAGLGSIAGGLFGNQASSGNSSFGGFGNSSLGNGLNSLFGTGGFSSGSFGSGWGLNSSINSSLTNPANSSFFSQGGMVPGFAKGGQVALQKGLINADVSGVRRQRRKWGEPYVKQNKSSAGYLRPAIKNSFSNGGLVAHYGIPGFAGGGSVTDDGYMLDDPLALSSGAIYADMAMQGDYHAADEEKPSLVDAMLNKATDGIQTPTRRPESLRYPDPNDNWMGHPPQPQGPATEYPDAIPNPGRKAMSLNDASIIPGGEIYSADNRTKSDSLGSKIADLFKSITGEDAPATNDPDPVVADYQKAQKQRQKELAKSGQLADNNSSKNPPSLNGLTVDEALLSDTTPQHPVQTAADADTSFARTRAMNNTKAPINALDLPMNTATSTAEAAPVDKKLTSDDVQGMVMKRIMDRQSSGINLPLLAMGAAILGDRSNSFMGSLGAGAKAYVGTTQDQNKSDLDALHQMTMSNYYGQKMDPNTALNQARIDKMKAQTQREMYLATNAGRSDPKMQMALQFYKSDHAAKPFDDESALWEKAKQRAGISGGDVTSASPKSYPAGTTRTNARTGEIQTWDPTSSTWQ